jgi:hypothetical protein
LSLNLSCLRLNVIYEEHVESNLGKYFPILIKIGLQEIIGKIGQIEVKKGKIIDIEEGILIVFADIHIFIIYFYFREWSEFAVKGEAQGIFEIHSIENDKKMESLLKSVM